MHHTNAIRIATSGATAAAVVATALWALPASAATGGPNGPAAPSRAEVLDQIRNDLISDGDAEELDAFDRLSVDQRDRLAAYFLDPAEASKTMDRASGTTSGPVAVRTSGDFEWGDAAAGGSDDARAASGTSWGSQWFAFAGIRLSETKVSETYEYSGTTAKKMLGYSCSVVRNIQPFTEVKSSKSSGYISGGRATAKCKVVVKRGVPTPWGTVAWSTYSSIQRLSAKGNGAITANRWE